MTQKKKKTGRPKGTLNRNWKGMIIPRLEILGPTDERSATRCTMWLAKDELGRMHKISAEYIFRMPTLPIDKFEFEGTKLIQEAAQENGYVSPAVEGFTQINDVAQVEEQAEELCSK